MPNSIIAAGAVVLFAGSTFTVAAGLTLGFSWGAFGAALILGTVSRALAGKPKQASFSNASQGVLSSVRQPVSEWQVIYGRRRVSGVITFVELTDYPDQPNQFLHMVITFAGHPCADVR